MEEFCENLYGRTITPCKCGGKYLVNPAGYIPTKARVETYLAAGRSLKEYQESMDWDDYMEPDDAEEAGVPLEREYDLDPADVHQIELEARARMMNKRKTSEKESEINKSAGSESEASRSGETTEA